MFKEAYTAGVKEAAGLFGMSPQAQELAALALLAAPAVHGLVTDETEASPTTHRLLNAADLAGLGLLAHHTLSPTRS